MRRAEVTVHVTAVAWEIRLGRRYKVDVKAGAFVDAAGLECGAKAFEVPGRLVHSKESSEGEMAASRLPECSCL